MIVYFADRRMNILGPASTKLPGRYIITGDKKVSDLDAGVTSFEFYLNYRNDSQEAADALCTPGNYLMRENDKGKQEFYTILDSQEVSDENKIYVYAEDAGLDLLNELVDPYDAAEANPAAWYINKFTYDSGFEIGLNEVSNLKRKLKWDGEATVAERVLSIASEFDAELSYSFVIDRFKLKHKYINLHKHRGKDIGQKLRKGYEINKITKKRSIADLATSVIATGGTLEGADDPITLFGYAYDDGDIYLNGKTLISRTALAKWSRYLSEDRIAGQRGEIVTRFSHETTSQSELCTRTVNFLKKINDMSVDYEIELAYMPDDLELGDSVTAIDSAAGIYLNARVVQIEESETETSKVTVTDFKPISLINRKESGSADDYIVLVNKPAIESVRLVGDKSFEELGLIGITNVELETEILI